VGLRGTELLQERQKSRGKGNFVNSVFLCKKFLKLAGMISFKDLVNLKLFKPSHPKFLRGSINVNI
jgi:hypothetical protein